MNRVDRFVAKVDDTGDCWLWTAAITKATGYGKFYDGERVVLAHRWSYENFIGPIPDGLQIDHLCRVRHCVRPSHLEPVTPRENLMRGVRKTEQTECAHGHSLDDALVDALGRRSCRDCKRNRQSTVQRRKAGIV